MKNNIIVKYLKSYAAPKMTQEEQIQEIIRIRFGSVRAFARCIGCSHTLINHWIANGDYSRISREIGFDIKKR